LLYVRVELAELSKVAGAQINKSYKQQKLKIDNKHKSRNEAQIQEQDAPEATGKGSSE
jgi:hypothetical protein